MTQFLCLHVYKGDAIIKGARSRHRYFKEPSLCDTLLLTPLIKTIIEV